MKHIVYIHGVTKQSDRKGYSEEFMQVFKEGNMQTEFNWSHLVNPYQQKVYEEYKDEKGFFTDLVGLASIMTISDAIMYNNSKTKIQSELDLSVVPNQDTVFICHSMGTLLALDFIARHRIEKCTIVSMGCNIGLFYGKPLEIPPGIKIVVVNEKNDFLGWSNQLTWNKPILSIKFKSKNFLKSWNWGSHNTYWGSKKLALTIKESIDA